MDASLERLVWQRARHTCEYCRTQQEFDRLTFEIDHIIAETHGGLTNHKGANIAGFDVVTQQTTSLFNPRTQLWSDHFEWHGAELVGRTPVGRVTVDVLAINLRHRVAHREALMDEGVYPT